MVNVQRINSSQGVVPIFLSRALNHQPLEIWGDGSVIRDFLHVSDVVEAILASLLFRGTKSVFNIGSGNGLSLRALVDAIQNEIGCTVTVHYKKPRVFDVPTNVLNIEQASTYLKWSPKISVEQGLNLFHTYLTRD